MPGSWSNQRVEPDHHHGSHEKGERPLHTLPVERTAAKSPSEKRSGCVADDQDGKTGNRDQFWENSHADRCREENERCAVHLRLFTNLVRAKDSTKDLLEPLFEGGEISPTDLYAERKERCRDQELEHRDPVDKPVDQRDTNGAQVDRFPP